MPRPRLSLVGTGNVAHELGRALHTAGVTITQVSGRSASQAHTLAAQLGAQACTLANLDADIVLICVADTAVAEVSAQVPKDLFQVHTSGAVAMDALVSKRKGVFYPLQTFTTGLPVNLAGVPLCLEASHGSDLDLLEGIGGRLNMDCRRITSAQRGSIHLAAVLACNFSNALYSLANDVLQADGMSLDLLAPLLKVTLQKALDVGPTDAQTGPARRNDQAVLAAHIDALKDQPHTQGVYQLLTQLILKRYHG